MVASSCGDLGCDGRLVFLANLQNAPSPKNLAFALLCGSRNKKNCNSRALPEFLLILSLASLARRLVLNSAANQLN